MNELSQRPTDEEIASARTLAEALVNRADASPIHLHLSTDGQGIPDGEVMLSGHLSRLIRRTMTHVAEGHGVEIAPVQAELTVRQAAGLLGVEVASLVGAVDAGAIPCRRVGTSRRILTRDLIDYQTEQRQRRKEALDEMTRLSQEAGSYDEDPDA